MSPELTGDTADGDTEARIAIWKAICVAADDVRHRFDVKTIHELEGRAIRSASPVPPVMTWQLIEALSLLCVILRCDRATANGINIFGKMGPVELHENGDAYFLWAQQTLRGDLSALSGRPDIVVTTSPEQPHAGNAARIIEAKCVRQLGSHTIRSEFGKAYDLRVSTYFIWSFYCPTPRAIAGAKGLGIDLQALGFDLPRRGDLVASPEALISYVSNTQDQARRSQRFARALAVAGEETKRKLLGPAP